MTKPDIGSYGYFDAAPTHANAYLWPVLKRIVLARDWPSQRAFDLGCGNGATCGMLARLGFEVTGVDTSASGIAQANAAYPGVKAFVGSAYDNLIEVYGAFPLVVSLEVIEHVMHPRRMAKTFFDLIEPGGVGVLSTPYHSYLKNIALALTGKMDDHFTALWEGGHIKFFSIRTLRQLLQEAGADHVDFLRVGRVPILAKSVVAVIRKSA
jgi:2-polyprenyl-6-hydroxyphenyl methylase/3-demethylubiquinone-9 3-methyltransferase